MTTPSSDEAGLSPEARRKAADALVEYIGRRWVVCDHAQIIDPGGAVDAVVAALNEHDANEVKQLRGELAGAYAELEKLRARFRLAPGLGRYEADRTPTLVALPRNAVDFLATLVGGTGSDVWGEIAAHFDLTTDHVRDLFDILTAAARGIEGGRSDG